MRRNSHAADYDRSKETLCMLPVDPCCVPVDSIAVDLGCKPAQVLDDLGRIRDTGIGLKFYGGCVCIDRESREVVGAIGGRYYDVVYPEKS